MFYLFPVKSFYSYTLTSCAFLLLVSRGDDRITLIMTIAMLSHRIVNNAKIGNASSKQTIKQQTPRIIVM